MNHTLPAWIGIDWGTTNVRVWGVSATGEILVRHGSEKGMGRLTPDLYPEVLAGLVEGVFDTENPCPVVICGMAGARQGWREAAYLDVPADLSLMGARAVAVDVPTLGLSARILPGVCQSGTGNQDVMRGEETQLLGLSLLKPGFAGAVCMPGTHSKWAQIDGSTLNRFSTVMTGEIFDVLSHHSVLRHSVLGATDTEQQAEGFHQGVEQGAADPARLTARLFKVRAAALLDGRSAAWCSGYLSGLLIGTEIGSHLDWIVNGRIPIVGGRNLSRLYADAFSHVGVKAEIIDAEAATLRGLQSALQQIKG